MKILLIEDAQEDHVIFTRFLKQIPNLDFSLEWVKTIKDAKSILNDNIFDIVVMDLGLPDGKGVEGLKEFEKHIQRQPFIVLTGADGDDTLIEVSNFGIYDYFVKDDLTAPLLKRSLYYTINRFLVEKEQKELNEQLIRSQRLELLGRITGGISHDINNKLAIIKANLEIFQNKNKPTDKETKNIHSALQSLDKAANLTRQLLAYGRKQELNKKKLDVCQAIQNSIDLLRPIIPHNITINLQCPIGPLYMSADPIQLDQVIMNLVINAKNAIADNTGEISINIERCLKVENSYTVRTMDNPFIKITVQDTGHGIEADVLSQIFEPFFTKRKHGKGTGLGLSVVDGIINQHSGMIEVSSEIGKGTQFDIYFPELIASKDTRAA